MLAFFNLGDAKIDSLEFEQERSGRVGMSLSQHAVRAQTHEVRMQRWPRSVASCGPQVLRKHQVSQSTIEAHEGGHVSKSTKALYHALRRPPKLRLQSDIEAIATKLLELDFFKQQVPKGRSPPPSGAHACAHIRLVQAIDDVHKACRIMRRVDFEARADVLTEGLPSSSQLILLSGELEEFSRGVLLRTIRAFTGLGDLALAEARVRRHLRSLGCCGCTAASASDGR
jgi:hypothetical protein